MTCQERQDQLLLLAFDQLDAKEEQELREHLAGGCSVCAGALAESKAIAGMMPVALRSVLPDPQVKERMMKRVQVEEQRDTIKLPVQPPVKKQSWIGPAAIAAAVAIVLTGIAAYVGPMRHLQEKNVALNTQLSETKSKADVAETQAKTAQADAETARADAKSSNARASDALALVASVREQLASVTERATSARSQLATVQADLEKTRHDLETARSDSTTTQTRLASLQQQINDDRGLIDTLKNQVQQADLNVQFVKSPGLQLVTLQTKNQPAASGHILWDPTTSRWLFVANGLKDPGPGKTYELWIITDNPRPIPAGTFNVDTRGEGTLLVNLPAGIHVTQTAVTDEPAGGVPAPTGTIQLVGAVQHS